MVTKPRIVMKMGRFDPPPSSKVLRGEPSKCYCSVNSQKLGFVVRTLSLWVGRYAAQRGSCSKKAAGNRKMIPAGEGERVDYD